MKNQTLFSGASDDVVNRVIALARITEFKSGTYICHQGDPGSPLILVLSGQLRFSALSENGIEIPIHAVNPGQSVGGPAILCDLPILGSVAAVKKSTVALLSRANARQLFDEPEVLRALSRSMAQEIQDYLQHHAEKGLPRADTRIAGVIMSAIKNTEIDDSPLADLPTHATIGAMAKVSRETVSRVLKSLEHRGVIKKEGRQTRVHDRIALQRLAAGCGAVG